MRSQSLTYRPALDGLRAVAVGLVFVHHAFPDDFAAGALGVDVFFVISGFLITRILLKQRHAGGIRLGRFYASRALRLYPPLIATVALFAALFPLTGASPVDVVGGSVIALTYTSNLVMTLADRSLSYLSHTWSLAQEEQFYLLWPAALMAMSALGWTRRQMAVVATVLAAASLAGWVLTAEQEPYNPLTKAGGLLLGCALSLVAFRKPRQNPALAWAGVALFALTVVGEQLGLYGPGPAMPLAVVATLPVVAHLAFGDSSMVRWLSGPTVVYLGVISYEIYLFHYPVLFVLHGRTGLPLWMSALVGLVVTLALAAGSRRWVSAPVLAWRDARFADARLQDVPQSPVAR